MEGCEPDPSEGPTTFHWAQVMPLSSAVCQAGAGRGLCHSADGLVELGFSLARAFSSGLFLGDAGRLSDTGGKGQSFPSSTSSPRGACRGMAWQPIRAPLQALRQTDRQTNRQISLGSGIALPVPPRTGAGILPSRPPAHA